MKHIKYPKIRALGNEENEGILNGECYIQEKIDGANLSVWKDEKGTYVGSRNNVVGTPDNKEGFRGAVEYVNKHEGIKNLLYQLEEDYPGSKDIRLFGEWLVKHTITNYSPENYNHFYLFDIMIDGTFLNPNIVKEYGDKFGIKTPKIFGKTYKPLDTELKEFVGKSDLGPIGEGIVIKNIDFINKFGNQCYAKIVGEKFKEENNIVFGNHQKDDIEMKIMDKFTTEGRIRKIINKIEQNDDKDIKMEDINKIIGMTQNDIITEEAWKIQKYGTVNFKRLKGLIGKRTALLAIKIINNEI